MMRAAATLVLPLLIGCAAFRAPTEPMPFVFHPAPNGDPGGLVVLLPGRGDVPEDFERHGVVKMVHDADPSLDVIAVDAHLGYYRARTLVERLHADVVAPRLARHGKVWLVGVSLGGLGALAYTYENRDAVAGLVLMAPFLGDDVPGEVAAAGGLAPWVAPDVLHEQDDARRRFVLLWSLLRGYAVAPDTVPPLWLAHGDEDYLREASHQLGPTLPEGRYRVNPGGHRWSVWRPLFAELLPAALAADE